MSAGDSAASQPSNERTRRTHKREETHQQGVWAVADVRNPSFGKAFTDDAALRAGVRSGDHMLVEGPQGTVVLRYTEDPLEDFVAEYHAQLSPVRAAWRPHARDRRTSEQRAELGHWDLVTVRPDLVFHRFLCGLAALATYGFMLYLSSNDEPASAVVPLLVTLGYPVVLQMTARVMRDRAPAEKYVFEMLLAFDLFQLVASAVIFVLVVLEAHRLDMLIPPVGHLPSVSSPMLRQLVWCHYHNRIVELADTIFRMSQKKFRAYGALHVGLRLVNVWSWWAAHTVGGGDVWFITALDAVVVTVRFMVFTLSILRWNWNVHIDFGMYAPKMQLFRKEHLYYLQLTEFLLLLAHALLCLAWGNMPVLPMLAQVAVMTTGTIIFTDFFISRDAEKFSDPRLIFSFDSSAWLFIYHFGVAMWMEDHLDLDPEHMGFSGSSGGALVACSLSSGINSEKLAKHVIFNDFPVAGRNPFRLLHRCELAMDEYLPRDAADTSSSVLRVLLTKVSRRPPFLMGEVVSQFRSWEELFFVLRASCHIPVVGGLLPYPIPDHGWFYDGLLWSSLFVPWRTFGRQDSVFKISPLFVWADIRPSALVPLWWAIFPPSTDALLGLLMLGYKDAQDWSARLEQGGGARWARLRDRMKPVREQCSRLDADGLRLIKALHAEVAWHWRVVTVVVSVLCAVAYYSGTVVAMLTHPVSLEKKI